MQIFLTSTASLPPQALDAMKKALPPERLAACGKCEQRTAARVLGYFLARYAVLQLQPGADVTQWAVAPNGKPCFTGCGCHFSLSYAEPLVAVAISLSHPVGVDIERVRPRPAGFAARWFSADEAEAIAHAEDKEAALALLWTKKEAAGKKSGTGLAFCPAQIDVSHTASRIVELDGARYALAATADALPAPKWVDPLHLVP